MQLNFTKNTMCCKLFYHLFYLKDPLNFIIDPAFKKIKNQSTCYENMQTQKYYLGQGVKQRTAYRLPPACQTPCTCGVILLLLLYYNTFFA